MSGMNDCDFDSDCDFDCDCDVPLPLPIGGGGRGGCCACLYFCRNEKYRIGKDDDAVFVVFISDYVVAFITCVYLVDN